MLYLFTHFTTLDTLVFFTPHYFTHFIIFTAYYCKCFRFFKDFLKIFFFKHFNSHFDAIQISLLHTLFFTHFTTHTLWLYTFHKHKFHYITLTYITQIITLHISVLCITMLRTALLCMLCTLLHHTLQITLRTIIQFLPLHIKL